MLVYPSDGIVKKTTTHHTLYISSGCHGEEGWVLKQYKFILWQFWRLEVPNQDLAESIPGEVSLPGLQRAAFLLCPQEVE